MQTPSNAMVRLNTGMNTPSSKAFDEHDTSEKKMINSPLEHITPRTNILIDKNSRNKISMLNIGKCKMIKHQRNILKPPKKNYTMNSNRNSSSESSFTSLGRIGVKPAFQDHFITPSHQIRASFDVKSSKDEFMNNTVQGLSRKQDSAYDNFNTNFHATMDVTNGISEFYQKGNASEINKL